MADVWSPDTLKKFKERQELLSIMLIELRVRTKVDKLYREDGSMLQSGFTKSIIHNILPKNSIKS